MLLIPVIILFLFVDNLNLRHMTKGIMKIVDINNKKNLVLILLFIILIIPQIYYVAYEAQSLNYGSGSICGASATSTFSISNFECNAAQNLEFFSGYYNSRPYYPAYFSPLTTIMSIIGFFLLAFYSGDRRGKYVAFILGLWISVFYVFYGFFYAGSATFGVDVRFMLIIYPAMAILAGFGIARISDIIVKSRKKVILRPRIYGYASWLVFIALIVLFVIYPFIGALGTTTMPYSQMPQESASLAAVNFIRADYLEIPSNCLVFTFTPDVWYGLNRSASQVGYFNSQDSNFTKFESGFSCFAFDWGYWCNTQDFKNTCQSDVNQYNSTVMASENSSDGTLTLYKLNNYKP